MTTQTHKYKYVLKSELQFHGADDLERSERRSGRNIATAGAGGDGR